MYGSNDMNVGGVIAVLVFLAIVGGCALLGGASWGLIWLLMHVSVSFV